MYDPTWPVDIFGLIWCIFFIAFLMLLKKILRIPDKDTPFNGDALMGCFGMFLPYVLGFIYKILDIFITLPDIDGWEYLYFFLPSILFVLISLIKEKRKSLR
jgi:hypothetical protein